MDPMLGRVVAHSAQVLPGGRHVFVAAEPLGPLSAWVEEVWYSEGELEVLEERVLPSATGDLVLNIGAPMARVDLGDPQRILGGSAGGMLLSPMVLRHPCRHRAVGARLRPLGVRGLLGVPIGHLNDQVVEIEALAGQRGRSITERCRHTADPVEVVALFLRWLWDESRRHEREADPIAAWAASQIDETRGAVTMKELQLKSGYGATRFIRRFKDELGVTPKVYQRLARFRAALDGLQQGLSLADLAAATGYTDQSHMGAEFRRLAGRTPTEVLATANPSGLTLSERE